MGMAEVGSWDSHRPGFSSPLRGLEWAPPASPTRLPRKGKGEGQGRGAGEPPGEPQLLGLRPGRGREKGGLRIQEQAVDGVIGSNEAPRLLLETGSSCGQGDLRHQQRRNLCLLGTPSWLSYRQSEAWTATLSAEAHGGPRELMHPNYKTLPR